MYKTSKYYSYIFYADRNVRPCTILGYTLTTFPKSRKTLMHNQSNRDLWHNCKRNKRNQRQQTHKLHLNVSRRTLHNWWRISGQQVFYTARKNRTKIRKEEIRNLQNNRKKDNTKFCILLFISKVKPSAG